MQKTQVQSLGQEDPLEKGMATHSSILAWRIPWTEEPGGRQSMMSQRVGHDWVTNTWGTRVPHGTGKELAISSIPILFLSSLWNPPQLGFAWSYRGPKWQSHCWIQAPLLSTQGIWHACSVLPCCSIPRLPTSVLSWIPPHSQSLLPDSSAWFLLIVPTTNTWNVTRLSPLITFPIILWTRPCFSHLVLRFQTPSYTQCQWIPDDSQGPLLPSVQDS